MTSPYNQPGFQAAEFSEEIEIVFRGEDGYTGISTKRITIDSTVTDSGNTGYTNTIRGGNILGIKDADGNGYLYDPDGTDGTQAAVSILQKYLPLLNDAGVAQDKSVPVPLFGNIKSTQLKNLDQQAAAQLYRRGFRFNDFRPGCAFLVHPERTIVTSGAVTVTAAQNGAFFIASGADTNFTLPTIAAGLSYEFAMYTNHEIVITGSSNIVGFNSVGVSTITATTTAEQIGVRFRVRAHYVATSTLKWFVENISAPGGAYTIAVA